MVFLVLLCQPSFIGGIVVAFWYYGSILMFLCKYYSLFCCSVWTIILAFCWFWLQLISGNRNNTDGSGNCLGVGRVWSKWASKKLELTLRHTLGLWRSCATCNPKVKHGPLGNLSLCTRWWELCRNVFWEHSRLFCLFPVQQQRSDTMWETTVDVELSQVLEFWPPGSWTLSKHPQ